MRRLGTTLLLLIAIAPVGFAQNAPKQTPGFTAEQKVQINKELDAALAGWNQAFNARDAAAVAEFYDVNTDVIYEDNVHLRGRQALQERTEIKFKEEPDLRNSISDVERTILSPTTVIETGVWATTGAKDKSRPSRGRYACTLMKKEGEWLVVHDRSWAMPRAEGRSDLRTRDPLSKKAGEFFVAVSRNDEKFFAAFFSDDVEVKVNNLTVTGKQAYLIRLDHLINVLFKNITFEDLHIHTNYFSPNALASNGQTAADLGIGPVVWTNAWMDIHRVGRTTGKENVSRVHVDFRWANEKVVEMFVYGDPTFMNQEAAALEYEQHATVTRDDFQEFCAAHVGWWTGEVQSVIGEADVVEKQEKTSTYYWGRTSLSEGGNAMTTRAIGPESSSRAVFYFDVAAKKIRITDVSSKGVVNQHTIHREGENWIRHTHQTTSDGTIREFRSVITWSENGSTVTVVISHTNADGSVKKQTNVWHRVSK
jgi:uncharacterized protein (TIGR02246 family)